jgi:hypothetical protein
VSIVVESLIKVSVQCMDFTFPQLRSRNPRERPKVLTDRQEAIPTSPCHLPLAIGTSKSYLPKVLRPLPTYLLLT